jgi:hypothetical protein
MFVVSVLLWCGVIARWCEETEDALLKLVVHHLPRGKY